MTTPKTNTVEEWEEGFDKEFPKGLEFGVNTEAVKHFIHQVIKDERNHIISELEIAVYSANNLAKIQNEPTSNQFIHITDHIRSIIKTLKENY
jgi:hypothetical protein